ncbi:MAG: PTS transporter subunit EIIC [Candidatus Eremiobacteraeota bacterium]|nr:PTS transporter subunit EIIC [Candidatus Eremiobacteraeota bacterium]
MKAWDRALEGLSVLAKQRHLLALRDGMIAVVPLILVGSTFLLLGSQKDVISQYFPALAQSEAGQWYSSMCPTILIPFRFTMGMLSVYVAFTIAASLAGHYRMPVLPQGLGAVVALMITIKPSRVPLVEGGKPEWIIPLKQLGGEGLFLGILCGLFTVELSRGVIYLWEKVFPKKEASEEEKQGLSIPSAVAEAFASFLPLLVVVTAIWAVVYTANIDIYHSLINAMMPLEKMGDTVGCVVVVNFFLHVLGVAGLHGISVINGVFFALWQKFLLMNTEAHMAGTPLPVITAYPFYQWFIWAGGAGTTLPVPFLLLFSRNSHMKRIGKVGLVPTLFNVNEPVLFGLPVVANPLLAIPFVAAPITVGIISFLAFSSGLVGRPFIEVPWVLPAFLGAPLCTQDPRALVLLAVNVMVSALIWLPFLRAYEKKLSSE